MIDFLLENLGSIVGMVVMVCMLILIHFLSTKSDVSAMDKKRIAKGMATMTEDEKQLANQAIRKSGYLINVKYPLSLYCPTV